VFAGVVAINGLLVFAVIVAEGASVALRGGQVVLDPLPVVLHGQVILEVDLRTSISAGTFSYK
jgi:hypothetical protein